ncbi:MAG: AAA family ATPase [Oryzomonas sp.]|uniref:AAA family ATPase n=1 Tax=Oryzomonas sp. TaxID=2855186 RepID=UPI00284DD790|nr:AAA family ATPase [Oryzomonas sp.]MDR3581311.1 AAA family ATPase [Oryzomonas sp.]
MIFYVMQHTDPPRQFNNLPACVLIMNSWDDYSTKSKFYLRFHGVDGRARDIGFVKILKLNTNTTISMIDNRSMETILHDHFDALEDDCISLGQDMPFYENLLSECGEVVAMEILTALRDISWQPPLATPFEPTGPFRNSMLRANSAIKARRFGQAIIRRQPIVETFSFSYSTTIPGAEEPTDTYINFDESDLVPGRMFGIIGHNAVGKTRYLSNLAKDLVQIGKISIDKIAEKNMKFKDQRPIFNRVIAISYSAFDKFTRPTSEQVSYVYCGIRDENGRVSERGLNESYNINLQRIRDCGRQQEWMEFMQEVLGAQIPDLNDHMESELSPHALISESLSSLSSGQAFLVNFITSLIAWLELNSLVLFDEPETHLHPNAVANLFNAFNRALKKYESFAIIATHSPVVIQEIPSKRVLLFERNGNVTTADKLPIETFGQNISELTRHVFETSEISHYYKHVFDQLSRRKTFDEVMELFEDNLSLNAQSYLMTRYMDTQI